MAERFKLPENRGMNTKLVFGDALQRSSSECHPSHCVAPSAVRGVRPGVLHAALVHPERYVLVLIVALALDCTVCSPETARPYLLVMQPPAEESAAKIHHFLCGEQSS